MKKAISLTLALAMCLGLVVPAFADQSTTTMKTAYKDLDARTEIYTVTQTPGSDYPYYGAKNEPTGGVYYGRTTQGGTFSTGRFGLINESEMAGESVVSFYHGLSDGYTLEYWSYLYGPALKDNSRAFLVYLNFDNEGADCAKVSGGAYDSKLTEVFTYLNTLSCPVLVRIGGEMNVWTTAAKPEDFIAAYRYIVDFGRRLAPRVAMVFSPNYSSSYQTDMDDYYPGDQYVDWIGTSLYYDRWHNSGDTKRDEFYGVGVYGDALLNIQQTVNLSRMHKKPIIITEGGSCNDYKGTDNSAWAGERMQRAYAFLSMVYPEIKCIISSDYKDTWHNIDYTFYDNSVVTSAYRQAVASNPVYVHDYRDTGAYYTKLSAYTGKWEGTIDLAAYTYSSDKLSAVWSVDGQTKATVSDYPYAFQLDTSTLGAGSHTVTVTFSNGATKSYTFQIQGGTAPATPVTPPTTPASPDGPTVTEWAKSYVKEAAAVGLIADSLGNDFQKRITRAQFAATTVKLYEAMGGEKIVTTGESPFSDTDDPVVLQAAAAGFVNGVGGGRFSPNAEVSREQAAVMLSAVYTKLGGKVPIVAATEFSDDSSVSGYAKSAVAFMADKKIINGVGGNRFSAQGKASIEQALTIALAMYKNLK